MIYRRHFRTTDRRLGRHVMHDVRSLDFPAPRAEDLHTVRHRRLVPIFDQGDLGSCTGNAAIGCVSTEPFGYRGTESDAVGIYSEATRLDDVLGIYPPDDTGSSGLAVMRALRRRGLIESYSHGFGLEHVLHALVLRPGIVGITWREGCDEPDAKGVVRYQGAARGGHEVCLDGIDVEERVVWFANSWSDSWGLDGWFAMSWDDFGEALTDDGDVVFPHMPEAA